MDGYFPKTKQLDGNSMGDGTLVSSRRQECTKMLFGTDVISNNLVG